MAMAASPYASTEETTNACRACRLLLGPCTDQMRDVLIHHIPLSAFTHVIKQKRSHLPRLTAPQLNLVLPRGSTYSGNYNDMDIPLLYTLLRNICGIPPHINGWGNDPDPNDRSLSANIERIRIARNQCVHSSSPALTNADFNTVWSTVRSAVVDTDSFLNNGNQYEREVDFLKQETMDPVRDLRFIEELRKQAEEDATTRKIFHDLKRKVEEMDTERTLNRNKITKLNDDVSRLTNAAIPSNVKEIHELDISRWKTDNKLFHETHNFPTMLDKVKNQTHVTFVGVPGSGKTATARHIALMLQQEGYEIVPIKDIRKTEDYCDPKNPQVFTIDDVVGVFGLQETKLQLLSDYQDRIINPVMSKTKTLMTCRETVYRKAIELSSHFTDENNIVLLHSEVFALNHTDKKNLMKMYDIDINMVSSSSLTSASKMFPYLCKLFSTERKLKRYGSAFFENPVPCILKELEEMKKQNRMHYASLVLCMINDNKLSERFLEEIKKNDVDRNIIEMKQSVLQKCKISSKTENFEFIDALSEMEGTYTKLSGTDYSFVHDTMLEIVAYHFGSQFPEIILQFMNSSYIANYVKVQKCQMEKSKNEKKQVSENVAVSGEKEQEENNAVVPSANDIEEKSVVVGFESKQEYKGVAVTGESMDRMESFDLCVRLKNDLYTMLAERLYRDIEKMELYDVFRNDTLKEPLICQEFLEVLMAKSYRELKSLFLSVQKDVSKVTRNAEHEKNDERGKSIRDPRRQDLLADEKHIRVISWVVHYGHSRILQYILDQTELHKETRTELFKNCFNANFTFIENDRENNQCIPEQYHLFLLSCYGGDLETVKIFIEYFNTNSMKKEMVNLYFDNIFIDTSLSAACACGHLSIVKELLKAGADVNKQGQNDTPLTAACGAGHINIVKALLEAGADINLQGKYHLPLTAACEGGYMSVIEELLQKGVDVNVQTYSDTPLTAACFEGHLSVVKKLLEVVTDVNLQSVSHSPLIAACKSGRIKIVKELIKAKADVNLKAGDDTPLISACKGGHIDVVKELLEAGSDVNPEEIDETPLIAACEGGHLDVVKQLLKTKAYVNPQGTYDTPLAVACREGHTSVVKELLQVGVDVNLKGKNDTPLRAACAVGEMCLVRELLEAGANVNPEEIDDETPLIAACGGGHLDIMKVLLEAGASVNMQDSEGRDPLYTFVFNNSERLLPAVQTLHNFGADATICGKEGLSALYIALVQMKTDVINYLLHTETGTHLNRLKLHLFDCLVNIRHSDVMIDSKDDVVMTKNPVWHMDAWGDFYQTVANGKCDILNHLLCLGMNVNQWIQLSSNDVESNERPLLFILIDEGYIEDREKKVKILLQAGVDVNVRVEYRECDKVLDRGRVYGETEEWSSDKSSDDYTNDDENDDKSESVYMKSSDDEEKQNSYMRSVLKRKRISVIERTRLMINEFRNDWWQESEVTEYKRILSEIKKRIRRYSV